MNNKLLLLLVFVSVLAYSLTSNNTALEQCQQSGQALATCQHILKGN